MIRELRITGELLADLAHPIALARTGHLDPLHLVGIIAGRSMRDLDGRTMHPREVLDLIPDDAAACRHLARDIVRAVNGLLRRMHTRPQFGNN